MLGLTFVLSLVTILFFALDETSSGRPGFVIGALKAMDGTAVMPSYEDSPSFWMSSEPSLPGTFDDLRL